LFAPLFDCPAGSGPDLDAPGFTGAAFSGANSQSGAVAKLGCKNPWSAVPDGVALDAASTPGSPLYFVVNPDCPSNSLTLAIAGRDATGNAGSAPAGPFAGAGPSEFSSGRSLPAGSASPAVSGAPGATGPTLFSGLASPRIAPSKERNMPPPASAVWLDTGLDHCAGAAPGAACRFSLWSAFTG